MSVTKIEIKSRTPFAGGQVFGDAGAYEQLDGVIHFTADPNNNANETSLTWGWRLPMLTGWWNILPISAYSGLPTHSWVIAGFFWTCLTGGNLLPSETSIALLK